MKNLLSSREVGKFLEIFSRNNVKLSFEKPENIYNSLNLIFKIAASIITRKVLESYAKIKYYEYDITKKTLLSTFSTHPYGSLFYIDDKKIHEQIQILKDALFYFRRGLFILDNTFYIGYKKDTSVIETYYYFLAKGNLFFVEDEVVANLYDTLISSEAAKKLLTDIRNANKINFDLDYISFNTQSIPSKLGFIFNISDIVNKIQFSSYYDYIDMKKIDECLEKMQDGVMIVQLHSKFFNSDFISLEFGISAEKLEEKLKIFKEHELITDEEIEFIETKKNYSNYIIKFRWSSSEKMVKKIYCENMEILTSEWVEELFNFDGGLTGG